MSIENFKCPIGLSNKDAICPECVCMLPIKSGTWYSLPYEKGTSNPIIIKDVSFCEEWRKKQGGYACGCAGSISCRCGYYTRYCFPGGLDGICPICGRVCMVDESYAYLYTNLTYEPVSLLTNFFNIDMYDPVGVIRCK